MEKVKVKVSRCVADWYEEYKSNSLCTTLDRYLNNVGANNELVLWEKSFGGTQINNLNNAQDVLAKMHLYGYIVEEKRYYWKRKSEHSLKVEEPDTVYLNYYVDRGTVFFGSITNGKVVKTKLTEKEVLSLVGEEDFNKLEKVEISE